MIEFDTKIPVNEKTILSPNLADRLTSADKAKIANLVWDGFERDEQSRFRWKRRTSAAMDLAMQLQKEKSFPWPGCANVAFPLVTIAVMQFHSQAYPAIVQSPDLVRCRVSGADPDGQQADRALRVGKHMSWQLLEDSDTWEEQHDRLLINVPIVGCAFKKTYYNGPRGRNASELVLAQDLVLDYYAKSVEECARKTHVLTMYRNELYEGMIAGIYTDERESAWFQDTPQPTRTTEDDRADAREGLMPPRTDYDTPFTVLEQHLNLDLDGDGYHEPYIATIETGSLRLLRLVLRVDRMEDVHKDSKGRIYRIDPTEYFTKYEFIPSPDGGVYGMGFGTLLGPLNESVNTILNQLIDAGTMATTAGGFLGRGAKIRGGQYTFAPLEWKRVDSTGDDLQKSIYPLPVREPSQVLFQLLSLLIDYTNRISGTTSATVGEMPVANTPASTTAAMLDQGQKVYAAIFKRIWRGMKEEFKKIYHLNSIFLPLKQTFGEGGIPISREDYIGSANRVIPAADPNATSQTQRVQIASMVKQAAMMTPGYNLPEVEKAYLRAIRADNIEVIYPGPDKTPPLPNPRVQVEQMKLQTKQLAVQAEMQRFTAQLMEERRVNAAKILQLEAQAAKLMAEANGVQAGHELAAFDTAIGALKAHDESLRNRAQIMMQAMKHDQEAENERGNLPGMGGSPGDAGAAQDTAQPGQ
ncbi:MAG: chaperonin GroES [Azoarcus sp.]|nr:chaperonin GroES [Azoarcus sp.]